MIGNSIPNMIPGIRPGQVPPFHEIGDFVFQELCRDLFSEEDTISTCEIYGVRGQGQHGIDLLAIRKNGDGIAVGQCKCYKDFPPKQIREVSDKFFEHWENHWSKRDVKRFILFVASGLDIRQRQDEILNQKERFSEYRIVYEVWSAAQIRNKLGPHPRIVGFYLHPSDHWIKEICGISTSPSLFVENISAQTSVIITEEQISQLLGQESENTAKQLICMRKEWQEGHKSKVMQWLEGLRNGKWPFLSSEVKADLLLFEAGIELEEERDIGRARELADEALKLMPSQNQIRIRAMIVFHKKGPKEALSVVDNQKDIDSLNLRATFLLMLNRVEEALEVLNFEDESNGET